ncbi:MAG: SDR family NAD(P)-dependent oxidoreductase [Pseudomonadota bacterium]
MFKDQVVWITGASSGIGEALAVAFHAEGAKLILSGRRVEALEAVQAKVGGATRAAIIPFETTDFDALPGVVEQAQAAFGRIDILINNAGVSQRAMAADTEFDVYQRMIDIDLLAPIALTQLVTPEMRAQRSGRIIAISSIAGKVGVPLRTAYCAAKHGVFGYFDALRSEVSHLGLSVHVVAPGSIKTDISRNAMTGTGEKRGESDPAIEAGMSPEKLAEIILTQVKKGRGEIIVAEGRERLIERLRRWAPEFAFKRIAAMVAQGYEKNFE